MQHRRIAVSLVLASLLGAGTLSAQAQATTGIVRGTVRDSGGAPIAGANIALRHIETNTTRSHASNRQGAYVASLLRVGRYEVTFRAVGQPLASVLGGLLHRVDHEHVERASA